MEVIEKTYTVTMNYNKFDPGEVIRYDSGYTWIVKESIIPNNLHMKYDDGLVVEEATVIADCIENERFKAWKLPANKCSLAF